MLRFERPPSPPNVLFFGRRKVLALFFRPIEATVDLEKCWKINIWVLFANTCTDRRRYSREQARSTRMKYQIYPSVLVLIMSSPTYGCRKDAEREVRQFVTARLDRLQQAGHGPNRTRGHCRTFGSRMHETHGLGLVQRPKKPRELCPVLGVQVLGLCSIFS